MITKIILVTGMRRSGTNLVRAMFGAHPDVMTIQHDRPDLNILWKYSIDKNFKDKSISHLNKYFDIPNDFRGNTLLEYLDCFVKDRSIPLFKNHEYLIEKSMNNIKCIGYELNVPIYIISLQRDVRAILSSHRLGKSRWKGMSIDSITDSWITYTNLMNTQKCIKVRYEDLVTNPEVILKDICNKIDIPFNERMLEYNKYWGKPMHKSRSSKNLERHNSSYEITDTDLIFTSSIDRWKKILTPKDIEYCNSKCGSLLISEGYEL